MQYNDEYPVGKAQQVVLDALGMEANGASSANALFERLGLVVRPVRQGRTSVPEITLKDRYAGAIGRDGDGDSWRAYGELTAAQMQAIAPWLKEDRNV